jgi:hypothetical protein
MSQRLADITLLMFIFRLVKNYADCKFQKRVLFICIIPIVSGNVSALGKREAWREGHKP